VKSIKSLVLKIMGASIKVKIASVVAVAVIGGSIATGVVYSNVQNRENSRSAEKKEVASKVSNNKELTDNNTKVDNSNTNEKVDTTTSNKDNTNTSTSTENNGSSNNAVNSDSNSNAKASTSTQQQSNVQQTQQKPQIQSNNTQQTQTKPTAQTQQTTQKATTQPSQQQQQTTQQPAPQQQTAPQPAPQPAKPSRPSGIDKEMSAKISAKLTKDNWTDMVEPGYDSKINDLVQSAINLSQGGGVLDSIKQSWDLGPYDSLKGIHYVASNVKKIWMDQQPADYYTQYPNCDSNKQRFRYDVAYWDSNKNGYWVYYVVIGL
jgi:flagellar biosynthesis GTPase FlhF